MTLTEKLRKLAEFDKGLYAHSEERYGAREENARLRPLLDALLKCVADLEYIGENAPAEALLKWRAESLVAVIENDAARVNLTLARLTALAKERGDG
jgi:hypothetical protein